MAWCGAYWCVVSKFEAKAQGGFDRLESYTRWTEDEFGRCCGASVEGCDDGGVNIQYQASKEKTSSGWNSEKRVQYLWSAARVEGEASHLDYGPCQWG